MLCGRDSCFCSENRIVPGFLFFQGLSIVGSVWCWECWKLNLRDIHRSCGRYCEEKLVIDKREEVLLLLISQSSEGCGVMLWLLLPQVLCHQLPFPCCLWAGAKGRIASGWKREGVWVRHIRLGHAGERPDPWLLMSFLVWEKVKLGVSSYLTWRDCKLRIAGVLHGVLCYYCVAAQCLQRGEEKLKYFFCK